MKVGFGLVAMAVLGTLSISANAQTDGLRSGDYYMERAGSAISRIYQVQSIRGGVDAGDGTHEVTTTDGWTFLTRGNQSATRLEATPSGTFLVRNLPSTRDHQSRLVIYRLTTNLSDPTTRQYIGSEVAGARYPDFVTAQEIRAMNDVIKGSNDIPSMIRNAPKTQRVYLPEGTLKEMARQAKVTNNFDLLRDVVEAAQNRSDYVEADFAKLNEQIRSSSTGKLYDHNAKDVLELLDHPRGTTKVEALAKSGLDPKEAIKTIEREAVRDAGAGK